MAAGLVDELLYPHSVAIRRQIPGLSRKEYRAENIGSAFVITPSTVIGLRAKWTYDQSRQTIDRLDQTLQWAARVKVFHAGACVRMRFLQYVLATVLSHYVPSVCMAYCRGSDAASIRKSGLPAHQPNQTNRTRLPWSIWCFPYRHPLIETRCHNVFPP
jgi:hypothetical protein